MDKFRMCLILVSIFLVLGAGCDTKKDEERESYSGTEGLVVGFISGLPPSKIWRDVDFSVGLEVRNKQLSDVSKGAVCFSSISENIFSKADGCYPLVQENDILQGRLNFPNGEVKEYIWDGYNLEESYKKDSYYPLTAKVCYLGESIASPLACIRSVVGDNSAVCDAGELVIDGSSGGKGKIFLKGKGLGSKGQGSTVAITSVYEDIIPRGDRNELIFTISVKNVGGGEVISYDKINNDNCEFNRRDKNKVSIVVELIGYPGGICLNNGVINLDESGEGQTLCRGIYVPSDDSFPLPLNIKLNYGYLSTSLGGFTIKKEIGEFGG